jgi:hypothetical protein
MGVDVAPVTLDLGMNFGIAVTLGGGGLKEASVVLTGEIEGIDGAGGTDEQGLGAKASVVHGAGGRSEVEDEVDLAGIEREGNVVVQEGEAGLRGKMREVVQVACG